MFNLNRFISGRQRHRGHTMATAFFLLALAASATAQTSSTQPRFDDADNELNSIDVQEGDRVKMDCR